MSMCTQCGTTLVRRKGEAHTVFARRKFCSVPCARRNRGDKMRDHSTPLEVLVRTGWDVTERGCWEWRGRLSDSGYGESSIRVGDVKTGEYLAHRLAHIAWVSPIPDGQVVRHGCDNPPCVNPAHLELGTQIDNIHDAVSRRRHAHGESHGGAKLTEDDVRAIRAASAAGESYRSIAQRYALNKCHVGCIVRREKWMYVA